MSRCLRNVTHVSSGAGLAGEFPAAKMCYNEMKGDVIMKSAKNNIRSFRYSDRAAEILEAMEGDSLNAKFENLVLFCYDRLPEVKSKYESYKKMADREWNEFMELSDLRDSIKRDLNNIDSRLRSLDDLMSYVERKCNIIVDKRKEGNQ